MQTAITAKQQENVWHTTIDVVPEEVWTKTRRLRDSIRKALIESKMSIAEAIALVELHIKAGATGCAKHLMQMLHGVAEWLAKEFIASKPVRRTLVINRALRNCHAKLPDSWLVKQWRREDSGERRTTAPRKLLRPRRTYAIA